MSSIHGQYVQRYNWSHSSEISSMAMHPDGRIVATGELGESPRIVVWDTHKMTTIQILEGYHSKSVTQLAFSRDGTKLASVSGDLNHCIGVYDWRNGQLRARCSGGSNDINAITFTPDAQQLITCGDRHLKFWTLQGSNMSAKNAVLGDKGKMQPFLSIQWSNLKPIVGTEDGHIYVFQGRELVEKIRAHDGSVDALYADKFGIISGGRDGTVKCWTLDMEPTRVIDIAALSGTFKPSVRSVCRSHTNAKILVGTLGSEIFELSATSGADMHNGPLVEGHCSGQLWGLAIDPDHRRPEFCTVGDDGTLRVWDTATRKKIVCVDLDGAMARCCAYSPLSNVIAVGLGGSVGRARTGRQAGSLVVIERGTFDIVCTASDSTECINDIKFSPDGEHLAMASHDNHVYLYDGRTFALRSKLKRHTNCVTHLDFSKDSRYLQTASAAHEIIFWDLQKPGSPLAVSAEIVRNVSWDTWSLPYGYPVQGLWSESAHGVGVNAVDRAGEKQILVAGDDDGAIRLYKYPSTEPLSGYNSEVGHANCVTNVKFTTHGEHVISTGGSDLAIMQWSCRPTVSATSHADPTHLAPQSAEAPNVLTVGERFGKRSRRSRMSATAWDRNAVRPTSSIRDQPLEEGRRLVLDWIYGFESKCCRSNVFLNAGSNAVYNAAGVGIVFDERSNTQRHYCIHDAEISALCVDKRGRFAATGDVGTPSSICLWDAEGALHVATLRGAHSSGISCLAFSADGKHLASVGFFSGVAVHRTYSGRWNDAVTLAIATRDTHLTNFACWGPNGELVTGEMGTMHFWEVNGRNLKTVQVMRAPPQVPRPAHLCGCFAGNTLVTGTSDGRICSWKWSVGPIFATAHNGPVNSVCAAPDGSHFVTGGQDGIVMQWRSGSNGVSGSGSQIFDANVDRKLGSRGVQSVALSFDSSALIVGLLDGSIVKIPHGRSKRGSSMEEVLVCGHGNNLQGAYGEASLRALTVHPEDPHLFATCGDGGDVKVWNARLHRCVKMSEGVHTGDVSAMSWHPDGGYLVCSVTEGPLARRQVRTLEVRFAPTASSTKRRCA